MNRKQVTVIGFIVMLVGMVWLLANSIGNAIYTQTEINQVPSEVEKAQLEYDEALKDCLDLEGAYSACQDASMNACVDHGSTYEECNQEWQQDYKRVTGA